VYTIAAENNLQDLAMTASPHLLSCSLSDVTDELAARMGSMYLKRLFFFHLRHIDILKRLILTPPQPHPTSAECGYVEQSNLGRAWALAAVHLGWDAAPDLPPRSIESAFLPLVDRSKCGLCRDGIEKHIKGIMRQWTLVKRTI